MLFIVYIFLISLFRQWINNLGIVMAITLQNTETYETNINSHYHYHYINTTTSVNSRNLRHRVMNEVISKVDNFDGTCTEFDGKKVEISNKNAFCIDGSKPAFYLRKGFNEGVNKWNIFFEGGGWSYDYKTNIRRSTSLLGSSKRYPSCLPNDEMKFYQSSNQQSNPLLYNWNTVHIKYCDGSSYAGDEVVDYMGRTLYFKGKQNRDSTIEKLLSLGMANASEILLSGCSAGGLGVFLGLDHMVNIIRGSNPHAKIRGLVDSGYFHDHTGDSHFVKKKYAAPDEAIINGILDFSTAMKNVFTFTNMARGVPQSCLQKFTIRALSKVQSLENNIDKVHIAAQCIFPKYIVPYIETPIFIVQPQYDQWQIWHVIGNPALNDLINQIGNQTVYELKHSVLNKPQHGAFFDACIHHCTSCSVNTEDSWNGGAVISSKEKLTPAIAFAKWYNDENIDKLVNSKSRLLVSNDTIVRSTHVYQQAKLYPCFDCCACRP